MKFNKHIYRILTVVTLVISTILPEAVFEAEATPAPAAVAATAAAKKKSTKKKSTSRKKSTSKKRRTSKSKKKAKTTKKATPAPPKELIANDSLTMLVNDALNSWMPAELNPGGLRVNSVKADKYGKSATVNLNENYTYLPVTRQLIDSISAHVASILPDSLSGYNVNLRVSGKGLAYYITKVDRLPEKYRKNPAFVREAHPLAGTSKGLDNDIIALWHSHGRYYKPGSGSWLWQRPFLFQSVEDTYTMSYILPYVVPMLENAGAYVFLPRERDTNVNEVIVDNDTNPDGKIYSQPYYKEKTGSQPWITGEGEGFIYDLPDFRDSENPFENGTYRQTNTIRSGGRASIAAWYADIPEDGEYAVYVSYKSLPNSTTDARYTVNYSGGSKEYIVNQTMGGGTWIYLGTFPMEKGYSDTEPIVTLTNISDSQEAKVVTADAIKIGGGMGNIARSDRRSDIYYDPSTPDNSLSLVSQDSEEDDDEDEGDDSEEDDDEEGDDDDSDDSDVEDTDIQDSSNTPATTEPATKPTTQRQGAAPVFRTSGMPRFLEGARYWLHWAGFPESVYSPYRGSDDYKDDYTSRGNWVNYLAGGSRVLPGREGLNLPVDMVFALHSDAGKRADDSFVGTLGIYFTQNGDSYRDGTPRINSRMLTDLIMRQICNDIRQQYEPRWTRRSMWDKSYVEARVPEVPTALIELMSHQNYADMVYGLDPDFRFTVGRAIYKGIARFMSERKGRELVIQPLAVSDFAIKRIKPKHYRLSWSPTPDPLEKTAVPHKYIIMERRGEDLGFHKIAETKNTHYEITVNDNDIHSFRIIAANDGGVSFPSETLALREAPGNEKPALIINGFTRVSAPEHYATPSSAGFRPETDFGVPYIRDISYTGSQIEYSRGAGESFGRSNSNYTTRIIAGNTFDYPVIHGESFAENGMGFVSCSAAAVEKGDVNLNDYNVVDLILGRQKATVSGNGHNGVKYTAFPAQLRNKLEKYTEKAGLLIISGEYVASDLNAAGASSDELNFAQNVLGISVESSADKSNPGRLRGSDGSLLQYNTTLNDKIYIVQTPDVLTPALGYSAETLLTFGDSGQAAGLLTKTGNGHVAVMSVPFETITDEHARDALLRQILKQASR